jgi:tetratricopeptide (TPR) repeat protein
MARSRAARTAVSAAAIGAAAESTPAIVRPKIATPVVGDAASNEALARLDAAVKEIRALAVAPILRQALAAIRAADFRGGAELCLKALENDEANGTAWYLLAIAREKVGDFKSAISCYESALALSSDQTAVANDLGRLALRLGQHEIAAKLFAHAVIRFEGAPEPANNLASALRELNRYEEAIDVLKRAIMANPEQPMLWNTLGSVLSEQGEPAQALTFFDEALRLDPDYAKARYNRGNARLLLEDAAGALEDCNGALEKPESDAERAMMLLARSSIRLAMGDLAGGWDDYEARFDPALDSTVAFLMGGCPRWRPGDELAGRRILLMAEQGLGDEVLFANTISDLIEAIGSEGELTICVEPRLVSLFARSFPGVKIMHHGTYRVDGRTVRVAPQVDDWSRFDAWMPMGGPLAVFRRRLAAYPDRPRFLTPDEGRVAHWRQVLAPLPGKKVGILWKSLKTSGQRSRFFSPFEQWAPVLTRPGVTFVNLQYGDCTEELEQARREMGVEIFNPPDIDLRADLDDVAALSCALDTTIGFANATINLGAACGAGAWMISTPGAWTRLGTDHMPWYPQMRVFLPDDFGRWGPVMERIAAALPGEL